MNQVMRDNMSHTVSTKFLYSNFMTKNCEIIVRAKRWKQKLYNNSNGPFKGEISRTVFRHTHLHLYS